MHGQEQEGGDETTERKLRHMRKIPTRVGCLAVVDGFSSSSSSGSSSPSFFFKDGRKICVGDCALFKPPQDSPPFIGIIRWLTSSKDSSLKLGVNWLYRPTEIKLGKGILLEAAPNEIFYSFHKDEIPAASLLHPCKVAFLPKGIELPPGISSFICRRVYDITHRCLWWLTDQDYINEHQEEVDQLLYKTRVEMHATVQPNGRSPKRMNGPTSSQLKPGSDCPQNSPSSIPSHIKGKKRERGDHQNLELNKRERLSKMEDGDHVHSRSENFLKSEIVKITEKGGLVDLDGVEKLVQLMLPEKGEKRVDLAGRLLLTGVIAGTDKSDCLSCFVQLKGLSVLDEWLQDVHKGKIGDGGGLKDQDKSVEEFLLVLLRALDKLPVNLQALQMCNIGKSVNLLRTHKNSDIQKKARSLVDTWKKRVEAEMNINDAKSGSNQGVSWSARSRLPEVSHGGNRQTGGSSDAAPKSSVTQLSASKTSTAKLVHGEGVSRSTSGPPLLVKSAPSHPLVSSNAKDGQARGVMVTGVSEQPVTMPKDDKSSSSSQSHNNSHSCSSDHAKTFPGKEDARSSTAGSSKISGGSLRHRKSVNGVPGSAASGRETGSSRTSLNRNVASEKVFQSGMTSEKAVDVPVETNSHKLIVKISNKGRSPAQTIGGGSEEPSIMNSRASSPVQLERPDQFDSGTKGKNDVSQVNVSSEVNAESWESNDFKDMLNACDEDVGSPGPHSGGERRHTGENSKKVLEVSKASVSSGKELKSGKLPESSFGSMNALIESCVNETEANAPASVGDDVGMNLLASVAAGEMFRSQVVSPADSPQQRSSPMEKPCTGNDSKSNDSKTKSSPHHELAGDSSQLNDPSGEGLAAEGHKHQAADPCQECDRCENELSVASKSPSPRNMFEKTKTEENKQVTVDKTLDAFSDTKIKGEPLSASEDIVKEAASRTEVKGEAAEVGSTSDKDDKNRGSHDTSDSGHMERKSSGSVPSKLADEEPVSQNLDQIKVEKAELKVEKATDKDAKIHDYKTDWKSNASRALDVPSIVGSDSDAPDHKVESMEENVETKANSEVNFSSPHHKMQSGQVVHEKDSSMKLKVCRSNGSQSDIMEECTSTAADTAADAASVAASGRSDIDGKVPFDLNEGFSVDDGKCGEAVNLTVSCSTSVPLASQSPFPVSLPLASLTAPIAVAAAAKGPFVPPDDLLKTKVELGWKGSAATSAFRPAEPRKVVEMSLGTPSATRSPDATSGKQSRPPLDIDLNVPDERNAASRNSGVEAASLPFGKSTLEKSRDEMSTSARGFGGLDLDLNRVDETLETWNCSSSSSRRLDMSVLPAKASGGHPNGVDAGVRRDFDLNDGPVVDDATAEPSTTAQSTRSSVPTQQPVSGLRMNNAEVGNFSNWFPPGNTFSGVAIPSILSDRGEQSFPIVATGGPPRMLGPSSGIPFSPDFYRGPVLSSSPAVPFSSTPFQYPVFPYGSSFPLPSPSFSGSSTTYVDPSSGGRLVFPPVHAQMLGPSGAVSSHYQRPFVVNLPDGSSSVDSNRKWNRPGLDLNTGPVGIEGRDETTALAPRLSMASTQALAEEQARIYHPAGGVLKRKEPEGGWDSYKQSSWQ